MKMTLHAAAAALLTLIGAVASAQQYPTKPIRFVLGGAPDAVARTIGEQLRPCPCWRTVRYEVLR